MYEKRLVLRLVSPNPTDSFVNHAEWFEECVRLYNEKAERSTTNLKKIEICGIEEDAICIFLKSELKLEKAPGRALTYLSRLLITKPESEDDVFDPFYKNNIFHGKLFRISEVSGEEEKIEDADAMKVLLDFLLLPKSATSEGQKRALEKIKKIIQEELMPLKKEEK